MSRYDEKVIRRFTEWLFGSVDDDGFGDDPLDGALGTEPVTPENRQPQEPPMLHWPDGAAIGERKMSTVTKHALFPWAGFSPTAEQAEVQQIFADLLASTSADGGRKRAAGLKPSWKVDPDHRRAIFSHLYKWQAGEEVDPDSGVHPLVHLAWRALAVAYQETEGRKAWAEFTAWLDSDEDA